MVDDAKDIVYTFDIYLKSIGYTTVSFVNPVEALDYFKQNFSNCMLVITDYGMPQMSGLDLIEKIREKDTDCKIKTMIISAYTKTDIPYEISYIMKIDKILEKPVYLDTLKDEVKKLITN